MPRWLRRTADLLDRARRERATPHGIGWAVAVGIYCGCTPFVGLHLGIALVLATLLRLNRLWAALGSRVSFTPLLTLLAFGEIELGHRVRAGGWAPLSPHEALAQGRALALDWMLGSVPVGAALAAAGGFVAYRAARRWQARRPDDRQAPEPAATAGGAGDQA